VGVSQRVHLATLAKRQTLAQDTEEFVLALPADDILTFRPGQFISVNVGMDSENNPILRSYSIASPPWRRGEVVLILRLVQGGVGSSFFSSLRIGDPVRFTGPMGFFVNELVHPGDVVYAGTGTGIAPLLPMAQETLLRSETGRVFIEWGLRSEADLFWRDEVNELLRNPRAHARIFLSQAGPSWPGLRGRITGPILDALPELSAPTFYLCGNGQMIEEVKRRLVERGVQRKRQIRTEAFFD
jgi:CDP-4-dehydro-6-deoxyglucose reductase